MFSADNTLCICNYVFVYVVIYIFIFMRGSMIFEIRALNNKVCKFHTDMR